MTQPARSLEGRTCLVTGASSGIGEETALALARLGARVVLVCRSRERGERSRAAIAQRSGNDAVDLVLGDLASLAEVRQLAAELLATCPAIQVLVNNAAVVNLRRTTTVDGLESTFAVNHLAHFLLTNLLLDRIRESAPARIVNVASNGHKLGKLDFDDLQSERDYRCMRVYGVSKLANVLFSYELARRLQGTGVTANCLHPGAVATRLSHNNGAIAVIVTALLKPFFLSPARGAATSIHLAAADEVEGVSGKYFVRRREVPSSPASYDEAVARRLWEESCRLTGLEP
jgi:NAD(P)-dependent dehydrogenase (short-subunit alcohol dehydrogenase family)